MAHGQRRQDVIDEMGCGLARRLCQALPGKLDREVVFQQGESRQSMYGMSYLGFLNFGPQELIIFGVVAILLFGKKLPDVARRVGGSYREFRKGLNDMRSSYHHTTSGYMDDVNSTYSPGSGYAGQEESSQGDDDEATAPRFEPPPVAPQASKSAPADDTGDPPDEADAE